MNLREGSARIVKLPDSQTSRAALLMNATLPLTLVAAVAVLARTWQLSQNDFGRQYYAAGVRSMLESWHNFLFNAFDPAGFVSIDKPPVAIWLQVASAKLFGFDALSILLAQVMAGLAAVLFVYVLVRKYWGGTAGAIRRAVARAEPGQCCRRPFQQYRELPHPGAAGRRVAGDAGS
jgi:4-amino-4-deoxy-L-arabinose transferase-like glycosyltransferase